MRPLPLVTEVWSVGNLPRNDGEFRCVLGQGQGILIKWLEKVIWLEPLNDVAWRSEHIQRATIELFVGD